MSGSPQWGLQQAIKARLASDATLTGNLGASVYDDVDDGGSFPYVVLGEVTEVPNDTMGVTGRDITITIHIWSQYPGYKEVKEIHNRVDELLDGWTPSVADWVDHVLLLEMFESFRDEDGKTRHGVSRYRTHLHQ